MALKTKSSTTEMQVTSIRFERELIDKLKDMAGGQGYQSLIREVLWDYVQQQGGNEPLRIARENIRTLMAAEAQRQEHCALTGNTIEPHEEMWMAFMVDGELVPLSFDALEETEQLD